MYVPSNISIVGNITPITAIDLSLNTFLGISWYILLPYTALGVVLMIYSQSRLMRGERDLKRQEKLEMLDSIA
jgi:cell division protein FtsL